jgi:hypothetical protein
MLIPFSFETVIFVEENTLPIHKNYLPLKEDSKNFYPIKQTIDM